jgi:hypothetical protein
LQAKQTVQSTYHDLSSVGVRCRRRRFSGRARLRGKKIA